MPGPISVTTITADTPLPKRQHDYELNIKVKMRTYNGALDTEAFTFMLNSVLDDWMDGRRPFDVEMIRDGLFRCLKQAAYGVVCQQTQEEFGNEVVEHSNGSTARWYLEAEKRQQIVPDLFDGFKVEITDDRSNIRRPG